MQSIPIINPINQKELYQIQDTSKEDIIASFERAKKVQIQISNMSIDQRIEEIVKINDYIKQHREKIIDRIISETGKSRFDALSSEIFEVCNGIDYLRTHAKKMLQKKKVPTPLSLMGKKSRVVYEPLGTVLIIAPWNYPFVQCFTPSLIAFVCGNAILFKPSELTPLKGVYEDIISQSNFLRDAIQVIYGGKETGKSLIEQCPDKIHFTGSVRGGKEIMKQAAEQLIPVDLELGGKDVAIVFDDVHIERVSNGIVWGALTNAGQSCTSIERVYVQENIYDQVVSEVVRICERIIPSSADRKWTTNEDCHLGCMTSEAQLKIVESHIEDALKKGAILQTGGKRIKENQLHFPPTVLTNVSHDMKIMQEETFGPVIPIMKFVTEEEVIEQANDSKFGLGGSVWTKDNKRAKRIAKSLKTGSVCINNHMINEANPGLPFGGVKDSGIGRYKGQWGVETFSNIKALLIDKDSKTIEAHWFPSSKRKFALLNNVLDGIMDRPRKWGKIIQSGLQLDTAGNKDKL